MPLRFISEQHPVPSPSKSPFNRTVCKPGGERLRRAHFNVPEGRVAATSRPLTRHQLSSPPVSKPYTAALETGSPRRSNAASIFARCSVVSSQPIAPADPSICAARLAPHKADVIPG